MTEKIRFDLLGSMRVRLGSSEVPITALRERSLLATLLLHAGIPVPLSTLVEALWGDRPPNKARSVVHGCVSRLRRRLYDAGAGRELITTDPAGYLLVVEPNRLDLWEFRRLRDEGRDIAAQGRAAEAAGRYRDALSLWRGPALAGIESALIRRAATGLDEERVQALTDCLELELKRGRSGELVPELTELVRQHPYQERLRAALMLALYRSGRQADALAEYRHVHKIFSDELGAEPGSELQELQRAILNRDPALDESQAPSLPTGRTSTYGIPRELPGEVSAFTGRGHALAALDRMFATEKDGPARPVVISAIAGTAGIGKTALAVHWAHRVVDRFPDGQLYADLRGYGSTQPSSPADILARFLTALGVAGQDVPPELDGRVARYRSVVAGRRLLIVLDNAATAEQVRPLLPGTGPCAVVVTSRDSLAGLVSVDGVRRIDLDMLTPDEAIVLLRRLIGPRADTEPEATAALAEQCVRLPLALRIAAELAVSRPAVELSELVVELADRQRRLEMLDTGDDPQAAVRVVFSWSIQRLPPQAARVFRLLGLHPGPDLDPYAASALANSSLEQARRCLDLLARAHLVHQTSPGRYGMHDLLRAYASHLATADESSQQRRAALDRLFCYYRAVAAAAMDLWYPAEIHRRPQVSPPFTPAPPLSDPDAARGWLEAEHSCLIAAAKYAASHGWSEYVVPLSTILFRYLDGGLYTDGLVVHGDAYRAAQQAGDRAGQAYALRGLGVVYGRTGRYQAAADHHERALVLFRHVADRLGEAIALDNLGAVERRLGRYGPSADHHERAHLLFRQVGDSIGEANALNNLGIVEERLGRFTSAAEHHAEALALFRRNGDPTSEASALNGLGNVEEKLGRHDSAVEHYRQALALCQQLRHRHGEATVLDSLGTVHLRLGEAEQAAEYFEQAITRFREIGGQAGEAWALNGLGEASRMAGSQSEAIVYHTDALGLGTKTGMRDQQARAHAGIGDAHRALGDLTRARRHYEQALTLYTSLGMPEAEKLQAQLTALHSSDPAYHQKVDTTGR